jgi:hypothetical protein
MAVLLVKEKKDEGFCCYHQELILSLSLESLEKGIALSFI